MCYARNVWNGQNFPFLSQTLFYENGTRYNQRLILDDNFKLDPEKLAIQVGVNVLTSGLDTEFLSRVFLGLQVPRC